MIKSRIYEITYKNTYASCWDIHYRPPIDFCLEDPNPPSIPAWRPNMLTLKTKRFLVCLDDLDKVLLEDIVPPLDSKCPVYVFTEVHYDSALKCIYYILSISGKWLDG